MAVMMLLSARQDVMGAFVLTRRLKVLGWLSTAAMALAVLAMLATWSS
jgi:Mn2+/Fe2+ NRAMP family transporter